MMLPLELWLEVFKYTDNNSFRTVMACLFSLNKKFAQTLYSMVCIDIIKKNKKIEMMNSLIQNPSYYRKKTTYINFKCDFNNLGVESNKKTKLPYAHEHYKQFIIKYPYLCFNNERDIDLFKNLTYNTITYSPINIDVLFYYKNSLPIQDIIKFTKDVIRTF